MRLVRCSLELIRKKVLGPGNSKTELFFGVFFLNQTIPCKLGPERCSLERLERYNLELIHKMGLVPVNC